MAGEFQMHVVELPHAAAGQRLDQALAAALPQYSRARLQRWIREGAVRLAGSGGAPGAGTARARDRVRGGERIEVRAEFSADGNVEAQSLPLQIVLEDEALLVLNKPAGLVVHPGAGNRSHTLQNALLAHDERLARVPRAGIVHRLDKDTSGLLIVARTPQSHTRLVAALAAREITREYLALVWGHPVAGGRIEQPIGRDPRARTRMAVSRAGRAAVTHYRIEERLADSAVNDALQAFQRQALHAARLSLVHPVTGKLQSFEVPPPEDLAALLRALRVPEPSPEQASRQRRRATRVPLRRRS